jgi:hypothetical protein
VRGALLCLGVALLAFAGGAQATTAGRALNGPAITVHYQGHFETQWPTSSSTAFPKGIPGDFARAVLDWKAVASITYAQLEKGTMVHWHYLKLFGAYSYTLLANSGTPGLKCRETLTEVPGYEKTTDDQLDLSYLYATKKYEVYASTPFNNRAVTTGLKPDEKCAAFAYWPEPSGNARAKVFGAAYAPTFAVARGQSLSKVWPTTTWPSPAQDAYDTVEAKLTMSAAR